MDDREVALAVVRNLLLDAIEEIRSHQNGDGWGGFLVRERLGPALDHAILMALTKQRPGGELAHG